MTWGGVLASWRENTGERRPLAKARRRKDFCFFFQKKIALRAFLPGLVEEDSCNVLLEKEPKQMMEETVKEPDLFEVSNE